MITRITAFTAHQTAEGMRLTYTYSIINEDGQTVKSNVRAETIVLDDKILNDIAEINNFLLTKVPE